jgi:hypothetical protein
MLVQPIADRERNIYCEQQSVVTEFEFFDKSFISFADAGSSSDEIIELIARFGGALRKMLC